MSGFIANHQFVEVRASRTFSVFKTHTKSSQVKNLFTDFRYEIVEATRGDTKAYNDAARLYNVGQFLDGQGAIDPLDPRYATSGGVHFGRTGEWYAEQHSRQGARLLCAVSDRGEHLGHTLFFTEAEAFPPFASDTLWMREIPGCKRLAYGYLTIVSPEIRGQTLVAQELASERLLILMREQVTLLGTEVFVLPHPNLPSLKFHRNQGAVSFGRQGRHVLTRPSGDIELVYAQFGLAMPGWKLVYDGGGKWSLAPDR